MSIRLAAHWLITITSAMATVVAAQIAVTPGASGPVGVIAAAFILLAGNATTPTWKGRP